VSKINIPEIKLYLDPRTPEAKDAVGFKWAVEGIGKRGKLGGNPDFLQDPKIPRCADCNERMAFYGQLDSIGDEVTLADVGMVYIFVCFDCYTSKSFIQC
jgi:hypothetical protein